MVDIFLKPRQLTSVSFKLEASQEFKHETVEDFNMYSFDADLEDEKDDFLEILKLRHLNLSSSFTPAPVGKQKQIYVVSGPRGHGKTTFMASLYQKYVINTGLADQNGPFCLFYFLEPEDHLINTLVNITSKLRAKYLKKDSLSSLDSELFDQKSIIEQFNAALLLGPANIFIDGLSELNPKMSLPIGHWLPQKIDEPDCKFVFTMRDSSEFYRELSRRSDCIIQNLILLDNSNDYENFFRKYLGVSNATSSNILYKKYLNIFHELKTSEHVNNPLFLTLIAQELFSFDKEIFKNHPVHMSRLNSVTGSLDGSLVEGHEIVTSRSSASSLLNNSVNIMNSYFEDVATIREIIEKILKRYLRKNNWSVDESTPLSLDNPGWIGTTLCFIALSLNGINKETILRLLSRLGYVDHMSITEMHWGAFRMQFGSFLQEGLSGAIQFSHVYFKEAVQALLLDGFSVNVDQKNEETPALFKQNISQKQKEIHSLLISDILESRLTKSNFDLSSRIESSNTANSEQISQNVLKHIHELIYHLYMSFDIRNLHRLLTSYKVLQIFDSHRLRYSNEWFDLCNYIRLANNQEEMRTSLIKNLTKNIAQYDFEITDNHIELKVYENYQNDALSRTETEHEEYFNRESIELNTSTDSLIDNLVDNTSPEFSDSCTLLLVNRCLILNDLMKYLDDKFFQDNYAFSVLNFIHGIVTQKYPLSDTEKLRYSHLLEQMAKMSLQANSIDFGLKYIIKCIEVLQDLFEVFNVSDLDRKFKTRMQFLQISNRLSLLHSNMALLLLKVNNLDAASVLLSKAKSYNSEQLTNIIIKLDKKFRFDKSISKSDQLIQEKSDMNNLIYRESLEEYVKNQKSNIVDVYQNTDDAGSFESKFHYQFISGLYQVQQMNFLEANRYFHDALDLSIKWYGKLHPNTSKIYHYYGCFFSLQEMEYYNPRRAELYLRKALYIREKEKQSMINSVDIQKAVNLFSNSSFFTSRSSTESQFLQNQPPSDQTSHQYKKMGSNDDQNTIAEILFDLGGLLATFDSILSKKEALECLRRSLDLKTLLLGAGHDDCKIIKNRLNDILAAMARQQNPTAATPATTSVSRETISMLDNQKLSRQSNARKTPASRNRKIVSVKSSCSDGLDEWIKKNSLIEFISKSKELKENESELDSSQQLSQIKSHENKKESLERQKTFDHAKMPPVSLLPQRAKTFPTRPMTKCPTSMSIDSNNEKYSLSGPRSSLKNLLIKNDDLKLKIAKKIYYKSAWYDLPHGSNQNRFKRYIKLTPNA